MKSNILLCVALLSLLRVSDGFLNGLRCDFHESVNITEGIRHPNQSITFDGVNYPFYEYAEVNYEIDSEMKRNSVQPHIRGCLCNLKPCIPLCCPFGSLMAFDENENNCVKDETKFKNITVEMVDEHNVTAIFNLNNTFKYVHKMCPEKSGYLSDNYTIHTSGIIVSESKPYFYRDYCLLFTTDQSEFDVQICDGGMYDDENTRFPNEYALAVSAVFLILTFLVYKIIPELNNNTRGKFFQLYLMSLVLTFIPVSWTGYFKDTRVPFWPCTLLGSLTFYSILSAALSLNVICFDFWMEFRRQQPIWISKIVKRLGNNKIAGYMVYALGLPFFLTAIWICFALPLGLGESICGISYSETSTMVLLHLPLCTIHMANIVLVFLTVRTSRSNLDSNSLNIETNEFALYPCLISLAAAVKFLNALQSATSLDNNFFLLTDAINCSFGVIIFIFFVLNYRVLNLIKNKLENCFYQRSPREFSLLDPTCIEVH